MGKLQPPNFTQTPNALFDLMASMSDVEFRVVMAIARETFGWHREKIKLSIADLEGLTGLSREGVKNGLKAGLDRKIIAREPNGQSYDYRLNVDEPGNVVAQSEEATGQLGVIALGNVVARLDGATRQRSSLVPGNVVARSCKEEKNLNKEFKETLSKKGESESVVSGGRSKFSDAELLAYAEAQAGVVNPAAVAAKLKSGGSDYFVQAWKDKQTQQQRSETTPEPELPGEEAPELLSQFLAAIKERVNPASFERYFQPIRLARIIGDHLILRVPNPEHRQWITESYVEEIAESLEAVGLKSYETRFVI